MADPLIFSFAMALAISAPADETDNHAAEPGEEIVVEGSTSEIRNELRTLLSESSDQLARVEGHFCPIIMGLGHDLTPKFRELLNANARDVGIEVPDRPCSPSAAVIFVDEPQTLAKALRSKNQRWFTGLSRRARDRLLEPVRESYAWQINRRWGRNAKNLAQAFEVGSQGWGAATTVSPRASRLQAPLLQDIGFTFLLIDIDEIHGVSLGQLADFATLHMMLPLDTDAAEMARPDSLLRLLEVDDPTTLPERMGPFDRYLFESLYSIDDNARPALFQRGKLASLIKQRGSEPSADGDDGDE
ncbi:hypothetical protein WAB17_08505 [Parerythrobacter aurantius]|uniref:hypothetical protein n=1 Tax=Parerythrobacter aurantius TaxID=3127706 RepID=UPI00324C178C